jgi:hypothetical protein
MNKFICIFVVFIILYITSRNVEGLILIIIPIFNTNFKYKWEYNDIVK